LCIDGNISDGLTNSLLLDVVHNSFSEVLRKIIHYIFYSSIVSDSLLNRDNLTVLDLLVLSDSLLNGNHLTFLYGVINHLSHLIGDILYPCFRGSGNYSGLVVNCGGNNGLRLVDGSIYYWSDRS